MTFRKVRALGYGLRFDRILNECGDSTRHSLLWTPTTWFLKLPRLWIRLLMRDILMHQLQKLWFQLGKLCIRYLVYAWGKVLGNARMMMGASCAVSGSGWMVSSRIIKGMHGRFPHPHRGYSVLHVLQRSQYSSGYAPAGILWCFVLTFKASWTQRMRWTKSFYQVFFSYENDLIKGILRVSLLHTICFMTIAPGMILTLLSAFNVSLPAGWLFKPTVLLLLMQELPWCKSLVMTVSFSMYAVFFILALITTISGVQAFPRKEREVFYQSLLRSYFMMTSNTVAALLFKKVEWVPTEAAHEKRTKTRCA